LKQKTEKYFFDSWLGLLAFVNDKHKKHSVFIHNEKIYDVLESAIQYQICSQKKCCRLW